MEHKKESAGNLCNWVEINVDWMKVFKNKYE